MKKIVFLFLFGLTVSVYGQDDRSSSDNNNFLREFEVGYSGYVNDDLNLNQKIASQNLPQLNSYLSGITLGSNVFWEKTSAEILFSALFGSSSKNGNTLTYSGVDARFSLHYNIINKSNVSKHNIALTAGASSAYTLSYYFLYTNGSAIDMNDLTPTNNPGQIYFNNGMLYLGPSASLCLLSKTKKPIVKLNMGYEFALTRGQYHSYTGGNVLNNIGESGNNRFVFSVLLMLNKGSF